MYTIREVSRLTGLDKRTIKYYVERKMIQPSDKKVQGSKETWLYSETDVTKIRQVALYRQLGYSSEKIRKIILSPGFDWEDVLNEQIEELKKKKRHFENAIFAAECMRYATESEQKWIAFDSSDFGNDIDQFVMDCFSTDEDSFVEQSIEKVSEELTRGLGTFDLKQQLSKIIEIREKLKNTLEFTPNSKEVQTTLSNMFCQISAESDMNELTPTDFLFAFRLMSSLSIERIVDVLFSKQGATDFLLSALEEYCKSLNQERRLENE